MNELNDFVDTTPTRTREFEYNGVLYVLTASDPYGMWSIKPKKSSNVAADLRGDYTSITEAERAIIRYHAMNEVRKAAYEEANFKEPKAIAAAKRHQKYLELQKEQDEINKG